MPMARELTDILIAQVSTSAPESPAAALTLSWEDPLAAFSSLGLIGLDRLQ